MNKALFFISFLIICPLLSASESREWTLNATGDIMLSRYVETMMLKKGSYLFPFEKTMDEINSADIAFANLETPLLEGPPVGNNVLNFRAAPENALSLIKAGFNVVSLANNHTGNWGQRGYISTFEILEKAGLSYVGAGRNRVDSVKPVIMNVRGTKIGFLAYSDFRFTATSQEPSVKKAGSAQIQTNDYEKQINDLKERVDVVIVSPHWGTEYRATADWFQVETAHKMIDAGADIILGHHPHVIENIEFYKEKLIVYSMGNFVFDQMFSLETRQGMIGKLTFLEDRLIRFEVVPVLSYYYCQPRPVDGKDAEAVMARFKHSWNDSDGRYFIDLPYIP